MNIQLIDVRGRCGLDINRALLGIQLSRSVAKWNSKMGKMCYAATRKHCAAETLFLIDDSRVKIVKIAHFPWIPSFHKHNH